MTGPLAEPKWRERWMRALDFAMVFVALAALVSLVLEYGQYVPTRYFAYLQTVDVAILVVFVAETFLELLLARNAREHLRRNVLYFAVVVLVVGQLTAIWLLRDSRFVQSLSPSKLILVAVQIGIMARLMVQAVEAQKRLARTHVRPAMVVVGSFLAIIAVGTALLYSPRAVPETSPETHMPFVDAVFTATSAVCVTGLVVRDTGTDYSLFGQLVILVLIQIGGLGLMTFAAFFALAFGGGLQLTDRMMMKDVLSADLLGEIGRTLTAILTITFTCEAAGAALLYGVWHGDMTTGQRVYMSVFHAVSGFCNAGFSLYRGSFTEYVGDLRLNVVMCALIVIGGIGFTVQWNLLRFLPGWVKRLQRRRSVRSKVGPAPVRVQLHSRIVLITTAVLIVVGAAAFFTLEYGGVLHGGPGGMGPGTAIQASLFQSITARTAGFNTVDTGALSMSTLFFLAILMFIGASPGGTGGGIKTSTFAMMVLTVRSMIHGRDEVEVMKRAIPRHIINRVVVVVTLATAVVATSALALSVTERQNVTLADSPNDFIQILFETMSAFGTVGLSTGLTPHLTVAGKVVIMATMLIGRIGPLTVFVMVGQRMMRSAYSYPTEPLMIG